MLSYSFKFQNTASARYLVYAFLVLICCINCVIIIDLDSLFIFLLALFAPLIVGCYLFIKHGKASDTIILDDTGFTSTYYGRVNYQDIESIPSFGLLGAPPPSMKIKLKSAKKISWYLSFTSNAFNKEEDAHIFKQFSEDLEHRLASYLTHHHHRKPLEFASAENDFTKRTSIKNSLADESHPVQQIKKINTRNNKTMWTIPVGLIFAVLAFIRTCGTDFIKQKKDREVRAIFEGSERHYQEHIQKSKEVIDQVVKTMGPIYLYSNDTGKVQVRLLPLIEDDPLLSDIPVLSHANTSKKLEHFIRYPDSAEYKTILITADSSIRSMEKSIMNYGDSTETVLYLRFYDPNRKVSPSPYQRNAQLDSTKMKVFDICTGVSISSDQTIAESLEKSMIGLSMMLAQARHSPTFKIYLTGAQKDKVSEELFKSVVLELNKKLIEVKADTSAFKYSVHAL